MSTGQNNLPERPFPLSSTRGQLAPVQDASAPPRHHARRARSPREVERAVRIDWSTRRRYLLGSAQVIAAGQHTPGIVSRGKDSLSDVTISSSRSSSSMTFCRSITTCFPAIASISRSFLTPREGLPDSVVSSIAGSTTHLARCSTNARRKTWDLSAD